MRIVATLEDQGKGERFSLYLKKMGIENRLDSSFDPQSGHMSYQIWVVDEDRLQEAGELFEKFKQNPQDIEFDAPPPPPPKPAVASPQSQDISEEPPPAKRFRAPFTTFIIAICAFIYLFSLMQELPLRKEGLTGSSFILTPIQAMLLFDLPPPLEKLEEVIQKYEVPLNQKSEELPPEIKREIEAVEKIPFWQGAYMWVLSKIKGEDTSHIEGAMFYKIRQGEIWRLFTPCLLHGSLLHILFNMLWVWVLGRPIEERIGIFKTVIITLIAGVVPNVVQYLMSGPLFLGYSGIVMGLAGFTWMRERIAPWEGYPLNRATILFLLFFIGAMFALQLSSFFMQIFTTIEFEPNIANSAHVAGAIVGAILGRFSYFSMRVK